MIHCPSYQKKKTLGLSIKQHRLLEFYTFLDYHFTVDLKTVGTKDSNDLFQKFQEWNKSEFWGWYRFQRYGNEFLSGDRNQLKENIKTNIRIPNEKHLQYPERKSKLLYSALVEYDEATRKAIVENLLSRLGDIGKPFLAQREASNVFENIKQFFQLTSKQRRKDVKSLRRAIIAVLSGGKVAPETLEDHLSLKRVIHTGIFEECREN